MPVPTAAMRPIFDADNPMYCARSPLAARVRPSSFMRKLLRLQSAQESPLKTRRLAGFAGSLSETLASSQSSSTATDVALPRLARSPSPTTRKPRRDSKTVPAPAIVLSKPVLGLLSGAGSGSPPKVLVAAQGQSSLAVPSHAFYGYGTKRKRTADSLPLSGSNNKRARKSSGNSSFPVSRLPPAFGRIPSTSFNPQPHFSAALPSPPYAPASGSVRGREEHVLRPKNTTFEPIKQDVKAWQCTDPEHLTALNRVVELQVELYGFEPGAESQPDIEVFVDELGCLLLDIRLKQQLQPLSTLTHQDMANFLGEQGYFSTPMTLAMFRRANVESIDLRLSLNPEDTMLTPDIENILQVFTQPGSFTRLFELNLNDVALTEECFMLLQPLRSTLQILWLKRTGTTDAMLPHLVCHRKLTNLRLTGNNGVTDEGVTNLLYLAALKYLELDHTSLTMDGLRRLAEGILTQERKITLEIPRECDDYMNSLHTQYLVHPSAPLITDPGACGFLALPALKKNLAEHAKFNDAVLVKGSRGELCEALRALLERRRRDMMVRAVMWQRDDEETVQSGEPMDGELQEDQVGGEDDLYSA